MSSSPVLVLHYNELWLKGCNRPQFLRQLELHVRRVLEDLPVELHRHADRSMIVVAENSQSATEAVGRLERVPGLAYIGRGRRTEATMEAILGLGSQMMLTRPDGTFAVRARRSAQSFPFNSMDIERALGARILADAATSKRQFKVNLDDPDETCRVEVTPDGAYVYAERIEGVGGLPTNTAGRLMCLLSGGIDSPVAAYKMLRRGVRVNFIHFHGAPAQAGEESDPIAREVVKTLTPYQGMSRLFLVPFDRIQREIVAHAPDEFRLLLYRRMMLRIAERCGRSNRCQGMITGDSIAQVASQTLQNIGAVDSAASQPVYRPLAGDDKQEIMALARKIGTYEISTLPFTDCCPAYLPRNPRTHSSVQELDIAESVLDLNRLSDMAIDSMVRETYEFRNGQVQLKSSKQFNGAHNEEHRDALVV